MQFSFGCPGDTDNLRWHQYLVVLSVCSDTRACSVVVRSFIHSFVFHLTDCGPARWNYECDDSTIMFSTLYAEVAGHMDSDFGKTSQSLGS